MIHKYRGLDKKGVWYYGYYWKDMFDDSFICIISSMNGQDWIKVDYKVIPETVGQFTGLSDKNGVEIYQGDILLHNGSGNCAAISHPYCGEHRSFKGEKIIVLSGAGGFIGRHISAFGNKSISVPNATIKGWEIIKPYDMWNLQRWNTVISNIHESPELMEAL